MGARFGLFTHLVLRFEAICGLCELTRLVWPPSPVNL